MNIKETAEIFKQNYDNLIFKSEYNSGNSEKPYTAKDLTKLREAVLNLENIDIISSEINEIKKTLLFANYKDQEIFSHVQNSIISENVFKLKTGLEFLIRYNSQIEISENGLFIKLPEIQNFDDLSKVSNDFKKAIELPIADQNDGGFVKIETAESGSIWLIISVGTFSAVNLIAAICWSAAVLKKKRAEAKIFEEHAKTLSLKNESLEILVNAQKVQIKNILESEAEEIANEHFTLKDPEVINRLKLSINTVNDLIDRGAKILPSSDNKDVMRTFPDYSNLNLIESTLKKLQSEN